jgi:hypothetical protein
MKKTFRPWDVSQGNLFPPAPKDLVKSADEQEDAQYGKGQRGDEIPAHIRAKVKKLVRIEAGRERLEREAQEKAERLRREREEKAGREGRKPGGPEPKALDGIPEDKAQTNLTDAESRILNKRDGYEQGYNCQAAVDSEHQVIVAVGVTNKQNNGGELVGMVEQIKDLTGSYPAQVSADAGYCSEANIVATGSGCRPVHRNRAAGHGTASPTDEADKKSGPRTQAMREKLKAGGFTSPYRLRKQVVEPVFGQIKQARGFRQFLHRGLSKVQGDWSMVCTTHKLLKLYAVRN